MSEGIRYKAEPVTWLQPLTEPRIREIFTEMLATPEAREFVKAIVRETLEEDARAIRERKEFQPTKQTGICYACLFSGDDMEWFESDGRSHLIHKNEECRRKAAEMPPTREHRG